VVSNASSSGWMQIGAFGTQFVYVENSTGGVTSATYTIEIASDGLGTNIVATSTGVLILANDNIF